MDKVQELEKIITHSISINERKNIIITGVKKIENFDNEEFLIDSTLGYISVMGENLEIIKLDTYQGSISINGKINSINYIDEVNNKHKEETILNRLFK